MMLFSFKRAAGVALSVLLVCSGAFAQNSRPIRVVVPLPAGTATDLAARVLGQQLSTILGQSVVIDNKPGANGVIGTMEVVRAAPDGHTLLLGSQSPIATNAVLVKNLPYDPRKDFSPINGFGETMHVLMVRQDFPAKTMPEFIAYAKQRPGKVSVGTSTTSVNLQIATMNKMAGIDLLPVPYKGIPASITDVIGGSLDASLIDLSNAMAQAKAGKLRPIAVTSLKRNPLVPDWPAVAETLPGFDLPSWVAMVGPANMPREVQERLNAAVGQALKQPELIDRLAGIGMTPMPMGIAQFKTYLDAEISRWGQLSRDANIQPE